MNNKLHMNIAACVWRTSWYADAKSLNISPPEPPANSANFCKFYAIGFKKFAIPIALLNQKSSPLVNYSVSQLSTIPIGHKSHRNRRGWIVPPRTMQQNIVQWNQMYNSSWSSSCFKGTGSTPKIGSTLWTCNFCQSIGRVLLLIDYFSNIFYEPIRAT